MKWPWPPPGDDGGAKHLIAGMRLPDVALKATRGAPVNLARFQERAVIFVYPFTGTPGMPDPPGWDTIAGAHGSTAEAEGFRDTHGQFLSQDFEVFGLSRQSSADQSAFASRTGLPFLLLSDTDFAFANPLRLPRFETGGVAYLRRLTLIVKNGVIYRTFYPVHPPDRHAAELIAAIGPDPTHS